jgi:predicted nucleotidyltransferase
MRVSSLEAIFRALNEAQAEYLVVGGVAVIAHGHVRYTHDLDLVLSLSSPRLSNALSALKALGFRPRIPVDALDFANAANRAQWQEEKGMIVFNLFSDQIHDVSIDIFPSEPFDFTVEYARAKMHPLTADVTVPIVSLPRLMVMKREAGRPQDLIDLDKLGKVQGINNASI